MNKKYTYEDFVEIIKTLRSENGCPWDREQTHESLRPCLMEEAAEVLAAIRILNQTGNAENLQEELGDVLLQVVMHAQIAKEEGLFTMEDVVNDVATKMVRRHPHVFGTVEVTGSAEVLQNWDEIKKKEKEGKSWIESPLREIPKELPALTRAAKVMKKADKLYGKHIGLKENIAVLKQSAEHMAAAKLTAIGDVDVQIADADKAEAVKKVLEKELGQILMAVAGIAGQYKLPLEQILSDRIDNFIDECEK